MESEKNETTRPLDFGEPVRAEWHDGVGWMLYDATGTAAHVMGDKGDGRRYAERYASCVNACAGIAEPEKAIRAAREALGEAVRNYLASHAVVIEAAARGEMPTTEAKIKADAIMQRFHQADDALSALSEGGAPFSH